MSAAIGHQLLAGCVTL